MKGNFGRKPGRRFRANAPFPCALSYAYFRNFLSPQPASPIKPLPRNIIVAGWKAFAPILAPLSSASPEGDAIKKITVKRRKKIREVLCFPFGLEVFMVSSIDQ